MSATALDGDRDDIERTIRRIADAKRIRDLIETETRDWVLEILADHHEHLTGVRPAVDTEVDAPDDIDPHPAYDRGDVDREVARAMAEYVMEQASLDAPVTTGELADRFGIEETHDSNPKTRDHLKAVSHLYPIRGTSRGMAPVLSDAELREHERAEREAIRKRRAALERDLHAYKRYHGGDE